MATYRESGVDLEAAAATVDQISAAVTSTWNQDVRGDFGGFAAGIRIPAGYSSPVLMMSTDGIGTKVEVARRAGLIDGLGFDLVAMCIDDVAAAGARPFAMTDYIAIERLDVTVVETVVNSIAAACREAGVALLGGETAEHPGVIPPGTFDVAGTALGVVEEGREITGHRIAAGNVVIGLESPNLRSNGFSLIRSAVLDAIDLTDPMPGTDVTLGDVLLAPSVLYTPHIVDLIRDVPVTGLAHITGGGLPGNIPRVLPGDADAVVDTASWVPAPIFELVAEVSGASRNELFSTFNMGIGFIVVVEALHEVACVEQLAARGCSAFQIGEIVSGSGRLRLV